MNLDVAEWKPFTVGELFHVINGAGITQDEIESNPGALTAVQSGEEDNGCIGKIDRGYCVSMGYKICDEPCLTVARSGSAGYVAFQPGGCVVGDSAKILLLKDEGARTTEVYLFFETLLTANRYKYDYGRKVTEKNYKNEILMVPVRDDGSPDHVFMMDYIHSLNYKPLTTSVPESASDTLNPRCWKKYKVQELFDVVYGINMELNACVLAEENDLDAINFVSRTENNNGISAKVKPVEGKDPQPAGLITCAGGGSVLSTFLQEEPFYSGRDLYLLIPKTDMTREAKLFCITVLKANKYKYDYGRQANKTLPDIELMLPACTTGEPDWDYMENYIRSLPYGDRVSLD